MHPSLSNFRVAVVFAANATAPNAVLRKTCVWAAPRAVVHRAPRPAAPRRPGALRAKAFL
jgi:hypothetical protein